MMGHRIVARPLAQSVRCIGNQGLRYFVPTEETIFRETRRHTPVALFFCVRVRGTLPVIEGLFLILFTLAPYGKTHEDTA